MMLDSLDAAIVNAGLPSHKIPADGLIHRFGKKKECWAVNYGEAGAFGDWSRDINEKWFANGNSILPAVKQQIRKKQEEIEKELLLSQENVAQKAVKIWNKQSLDGDSGYLQRKQVSGYGIRFSKNGIVIPIYDIHSKLWSLQFINNDSTKYFLLAGRKRSCFYILGNILTSKSAYIVEGYATGASIYEATGKPVIVAFDAGNLIHVVEAIKSKHPALNMIIAADNDQWKDKNTGKDKAQEVANKYGCKVVLPTFKDTSTKPTDFNDLHALEGLEAVKQQVTFRLKAVTLTNLLSMDIEPQEMLLSPIIPKQGLGMLYAYRGAGKTFVSLGIAYAVATGSNFLKWKADKPYKVLVVDGEMPARALQERLAGLVKSNDKVPPATNYLQIITPDFQERGIPSITTAEGQEALEPHIQGVQLIILDNISSLCRGGRENEAESWLPVQEWALSLRSRGISVLFIHHSGKGEQQRGTSRREDVLDTVIALKKPKDYEDEQGARFEVHYEKHRYFFGEDAKPFEAQLNTDSGKQEWTIKELEDDLLQAILDLEKQGMTQREIANELGISASKVNRLLKKSKKNGGKE